MSLQTITDTETVTEEPLCDFLLIIALKEEFRYFISALKAESQSRFIQGRHCYSFKLPAPMGMYSEGIASFIGEMGAEEAAILTSQLLSATKAGLVINIGISGIVDDELKLGDVITATEADNYLFQSKIHQRSHSRKLSFRDIKIAGKSLPTTVFLSDTLNNLEFTDPKAWEVWLDNSHKELISLISDSDFNYLKEEGLVADKTKLYQGPVATGPWVGASEQFKHFLKAERNRNYLAMDMESAGVLQAIRRSPFDSQSIVLRGISDPADERKAKLEKIKDGAIRAWAMGNALRLLFLLISKVKLESYTRRDLSTLAKSMNAPTGHVVTLLHDQNTNKQMEQVTRVEDTSLPEGVRKDLISTEQIEQILHNAVTCGLASAERRLLLLASIPRQYSYSLPQQANPLDQLRSDLLEMNVTLSIIGPNEPPLITWLQNAARLVHPRPEANFFEEMALIIRRKVSSQ